MTKKIDPDIKALKGAMRALDGSSSINMLRANVEFMFDKFVRNPNNNDIIKFLERKTRKKLK